MINNKAWQIVEHHDIEKTCWRLPPQVQKKYEFWKELIYKFGPEVLKKYPGYHDEKLNGWREGQRSSRLNLQYRVIYSVQKELVRVNVIEITPHRY
ncbi:MAG: hypothetical protein A2901_00400 [Elusimicrobia bacterium RIFCSPLOWO2_01_FULL_54_10]|nr:MAG: hypothetical protein A2901_00400 [Elusimicrobia bacterium RIFCSPLOWO2_01_FULL_54_10]